VGKKWKITITRKQKVRRTNIKWLNGIFATTTNAIRHRRRVKSISTCLLAIPLTFLGGKSFINDNFLSPPPPTQTNI
jgi:hypothetical protein